MTPAPPLRRAPLPAVLAAFAVIYSVWSTTYLANRMIVEVLPPLLSRGACCLAAGMCLFGAARLLGAPAPTGLHWRASVPVGLLMFLGCQGLLSVAQRHVASGLAALLVATVPLWIPLLAWAAPGGTRPAAALFGSAALGLGGVAVLAGGAGALGGLSPGWAAVMAFSALCWAAGTVLLRRLPRPDSPWLTASLGLLTGGVVIILLGLALGEAAQPLPHGIPGRVWGALAYTVLANYVLAFGCYHWLLTVCPAPRVATYAYVNPLLAMLLGWLVANEALTLGMLAAAVPILAAVALAVQAPGGPAGGGAASKPSASTPRGAIRG